MTSIAGPAEAFEQIRNGQRRRWLMAGVVLLFITSCFSLFIGTHYISPVVTLDAIFSFD